MSERPVGAPSAVNLLHWATAAVQLVHAIRALQADPMNVALLREEERLADVVLDTAFELARAGWEN